MRAIEYTSSDAAVRLPSVPSFTEGFRRDPMAQEAVFERIASFDRVVSPTRKHMEVDV